MIDFILESSISLGVLYACYCFFFSRDKRFLFNRCYLLAAVTFSLVLPLVTLPAFFQQDYFDDSHNQFIEGGIQILRTADKTPGAVLTVPDINGSFLAYLVLFIYAGGVLVMAFRYLKNVLTIQRLIRRAKKYTRNGIRLALVRQPVSPFCFGRYVIVNNDAYTRGEIDEDILLHEKTHMSHGHTLDNLFIECLLMFYWFNPLLWCYRSALHANHEFCADHVASSRSGIEAYCYKLARLTSPQGNPLPGSGFSFLLTKKRIVMMNHKKSSFFSFGRKLLITCAITLAMLTVFSFKDIAPQSTPLAADAAFTVVIDPGHGGDDAGGHNAEKDLLEKELVMDIVAAIKAAKKDPAIKLIYTRQADHSPSMQERIQVAKEYKADLFLSLHINGHDNPERNGVEVFYSGKNVQSSLSESYSRLFASGVKLAQGPAVVKKANFIVLRKNVCPAVTLQLGFITNERDAAFLSSKKNQQQLAEDILKTVTRISKL